MISDKLRLEAFYEYKKRAPEGKCWVKRCPNMASNGCLCSKHYMRRWRHKNVESATYCTLRDHARGRKIAFTINIDYWKGLTDGYNFFQQKDRKEILTIDRVDPCRGYEPGNLRVVSISENVAKGNRERYLPEHVQEMLRREREQTLQEYAHHLEEDDEDDCPF